ncbi:YpmS family protein [Ferdinandcohnia quinoae]|uniref:YpmS family protein n=1 Tax=Fredinandcohnia quinoae TaxID=2918902 RepID=A0AAW5E8L2_9BACI|nr:YpmS family protein [Fredinandcohnia sp. SECRCQ15]MCH1626361.1 YpmS family protein [Fredinandcohnia sp. SECRCQ15]
MKKNKWKILFFVVISINCIALLYFCIMTFLPSDTEIPKMELNKQDGIELGVVTNKEDLTKLINNYLKKESKDIPLDYKVLLTDKVMLIGTITVFEKEIDIVLTFEPEALDNGDLLLRQESITLGQLELPVTYVMRYISDHYALPEWVKIDPKNQLVYANLSEMEVKSNMKIKVDNFNLKNDNLKFKIVVPN